jgi:tetratricopeptide (TPR) repeat protein
MQAPTKAWKDVRELRERRIAQVYTRSNQSVRTTALGSLLKGLGMTIWGLIAFGLLAIFVFVGYQAALKSRSPSTSVADTHNANRQLDGSPAFTQSNSDTVQQATPEPQSASKSISSDAARTLFRDAAEQHQFGATVEYGKQLVDSGSASPDDLVIIAHAFYSIGDCANALTWVDRANEALQATGSDPDESLHRMKLRCGSNNRDKNPPQLDAHATKNQSGNPDVRLGELYYGFGDYQHAIFAIQRGLEKGGVMHLDDAYVYLGLSQLAVKNIAEACKAFYKLQDVPNINPRILKLWELFADTRC